MRKTLILLTCILASFATSWAFPIRENSRDRRVYRLILRSNISIIGKTSIIFIQIDDSRSNECGERCIYNLFNHKF